MNTNRTKSYHYHKRLKSARPKTSKARNQHDSYNAFVPRADRRLKKFFKKIGIPENSQFLPDPFQLEALQKLKTGDVLVSAPTGSGKTWIAVQAMKEMLSPTKHIWYATPLKALSNAKYYEFSTEFGVDNVGILTGERKENTEAPIIVGTTEILRNHLYDAMYRGFDFSSDLVVLDEAHFLGDPDRGVVWEEVIIYLPSRVKILLLSATIQNFQEIAEWLSNIRQNPCHVVHAQNRPVPIYPLYLLPGGEILPLSGFQGLSPKIKDFLEINKKTRLRRASCNLPFSDILTMMDEFNLLPAIFFLSSRTECNNALLSCTSRMLSKQKTQQLKQVALPFFKEYPFLKKHPQLPYIFHHGVGAHHGGQLPHWKIFIEQLMNNGLIDAIFSTSTVAAGVNFPARTVVLAQSDRFNGREFVDLTAMELHQAAGRAGRRGKDKIGFTLFLHGPFQDPHLVDLLLDSPPEPIKSQLKINFSMTLNLLLSHTPDEVNNVLELSFASFQKQSSIKQLDDRQVHLESRMAEKMRGCNCRNPEDVFKRILKRRDASNRLSLIKRKIKKFGKDHKQKYDSLTEKMNAVEEGLRALPCNGCSHFSLCHRGTKNHFFKLAAKLHQNAALAKQAKDALWCEFERHYHFLILNGFATESGKLTQDGIWAAKLRIDQPLLIAELIRKGAFNELSPHLMTAILATFVNDKFREIDIDYSLYTKTHPLRIAYAKMRKTLENIIALKEKYGFVVPVTQLWPALALYLWAGGKNWNEFIRQIPVDEGDLAMLIFRTADNLRQIISLQETHPELAEKAKEALPLILREPVIVPS